jgi:hypothetical protein
MVAVLVGSAVAQEPAPVTAKVARVTGAARYSSDGTTWKNVKAGTTLKPSVFVQTALTNATVDIQLGEPGGGGNLVRLMPNSLLEIKNLSVKGSGAERVEETQLDLRTGQMLGSTKKMNPASRYEVMLPSGAVGVQPAAPESDATRFVVNSSGSLSVMAGTMLISKADAEVHTQVVAADQRFDPTTGTVAPLPADAPEKKLTLP